MEHSARLSVGYRSGDPDPYHYSSSFTCLPTALPFRPRRATPRPFVQGTQTAVVVGPPGEEIFTDKYGRVKVQFPWDRQGQLNEKSSRWVRVGTIWAGRQWGAIHIPRIGQEVIVAFEEGDPDQPIIVGSVYNAEQMPPFGLPEKKVVSGIKSQAHQGAGYNEMTFDDTAGQEKITVHGLYDMNTTVEHDDSQTVHNNRTISVDGTHTETIKKDTKITITEGTCKHDVAANTASYHVKGALTEKYDDTQTTTVTKEIAITSESAHIYIHAATSIQLHVGGSKLWMAEDGRILLEGANIAIKGSESVSIKGGSIRSEADQEHEIKGAIVKSDGSAQNTVKGGVVLLNP